jgi:DNA transposition AAA+ family ATPase
MDLVQRCMEYMEEKKLSQAKLAALIGIGESTFSRWLKGTYPNPESISQKVEIFFEKESMRKEVAVARDIEFAMTTISKKVWQVLEYCRLQRIVGAVYGDAGVGKTRTMEEWKEDKPDVISVTASPAFGSPKPFLKLLARELKTSRVGGVDDIFLDILDKLTGGDRTIVIDEAQHLNRKTLEVVRSINDSTRTAIILIGNETVYSKMVGKQQAEFAQLFSRLGMRNHILTDMFMEEDVLDVFGEHDKEVIDHLLAICRSKYGLRGATHVFANAQNNGDVSIKGIKAMAKLMGILV